MRDPLGRLFPNMPHGYRVALDWIFTIVGAIVLVLVAKGVDGFPFEVWGLIGAIVLAVTSFAVGQVE